MGRDFSKDAFFNHFYILIKNVTLVHTKVIKNKSNFDRKEQKVLRFFFSIAFEKETIFRKCAQNYPEHYPTKQKKSHHSDLANIRMRNEGRFMYKINQGHLTVFCIVFV